MAKRRNRIKPAMRPDVTRRGQGPGDDHGIGHMGSILNPFGVPRLIVLVT